MPDVAPTNLPSVWSTLSKHRVARHHQDKNHKENDRIPVIVGIPPCSIHALDPVRNPGSHVLFLSVSSWLISEHGFKHMDPRRFNLGFPIPEARLFVEDGMLTP
ncbi:hypothetical protein CISG_08923 [Coccidioides immitis RMSCC 3703]|uniref:Uncharacterized protein n=1 Tax=Coccidioides immitis RMSCC 3703 TaxID=454286 RepID=A0A0J8R7X9_COCIT|nr:hypothetical protein CISG_08923 [Coccidioides immitis RMSCC 3703]